MLHIWPVLLLLFMYFCYYTLLQSNHAYYLFLLLLSMKICSCSLSDFIYVYRVWFRCLSIYLYTSLWVHIRSGLAISQSIYICSLCLVWLHLDHMHICECDVDDLCYPSRRSFVMLISFTLILIMHFILYHNRFY